MAIATGTLAAISAGAGLASTVGGMIQGSKDRKAANAAYQRAMEEIEKVGAPPNLAREIFLKEFKSAGVLTPELEQNINLEASKVAQIQEDPRLKDAQLRALEQMQQVGRGLSPQERATFNKLRSEVQRDTEAKRQQIVQNMQARGQAGSGAELAAALMSSQAGADQASEAGDRIAAASAERALQAMLQSGQLGGQIRSQDFGVAQAKASAEDEMNRMKYQTSIGMQQRNIDRANEAQAGNLQNQQQIMNANTAMANQERLRKLQAEEDYWKNRLGAAQTKAGLSTGQSDRLSNQAQSKAQGMATVASGAFDAAAKLYGMDKPEDKKPKL
jgi:hypothetical protein